MQQKPLAHYKTFVYDSARWEGFELRPGDIVISTPPKSGTTWTQRICALLVFGTPELDRPLTSVSPWIDMLTLPKADVFAGLAAQTHRRFIKTHTPFDGLPWDERVTYLCVGRDPRDVALSWDNHMANTDTLALFSAREAAVGNEDIAEMIENGPPPLPESAAGRFWHFVENATPAHDTPCSLLGVLHHLSSFWTVRERPNVVMLHYDQLQADLEGSMRRLAARLGITIPEEAWPGLVQAATFAEMKRNADKMAPAVTEKVWIDPGQFFHRGTSGQWQGLFGEGDVERYNARIRELVDDPRLAAWAHHGSLER
ncbi:MAG: sulfotransferase domain-containing protein [Candidatus Binatia bacterium]